jgi:ABC-type sugar transport system ATPase subunit
MAADPVESPWRTEQDRQQHRGAKRDAVLAAAARLFTRSGFQGTSLDDIARSLRVTKWSKLLNIRAASKGVKVIELSGGNQQKVVIAKSLVQEPDVIIFDEPTRGVDVGAIAEIHAEINRLADAGKAVVVISSYLPEVMALSDRILVAKQGKVVVEFSAIEATQEGIIYAAIH